MKGDVIHIGVEHRRAAEEIAEHLSPRIKGSEQAVAITVAGESGSGKSETGHALADALEQRGLRVFVFQQDDYFKLPPKSNDKKRRADPTWVGTDEVQLDLLDSHLATAKAGEQECTKPLVDYDNDQIEQEVVNLAGYDAVIAEGTYTTLLTHADVRVFIDRDRLQTLESRKQRAREPIEPFIESILETEHSIIAPHKQKADIVISSDYSVSLPDA